MPRYSSAAARLPVEPEQGQRSLTFARTTMLHGERMPPPLPPNTEKENATARRIAEYVARIQLQNEMALLRAEMDTMRKQTEAVMAAQAHVTERSIEIATLTKSASLIVLLVCGLSLVVGVLSGFNAIHPSVALLLGTAGVIFFIMGAMLAKGIR